MTSCDARTEFFVSCYDNFIIRGEYVNVIIALTSVNVIIAFTSVRQAGPSAGWKSHGHLGKRLTGILGVVECPTVFHDKCALHSFNTTTRKVNEKGCSLSVS